MNLNHTGRHGFAVAAALTLNACAWLPGGRPPAPPAEVFARNLVEIQSTGLLATREGIPELALTLDNVSDFTVWVSVHFQTPEETSDCVLAKEMEAQTRQTYICAQPALQAEIRYPIRIAVFTAMAQAEPAETIDTSLIFNEADVQAARGE